MPRPGKKYQNIEKARRILTSSLCKFEDNDEVAQLFKQLDALDSFYNMRTALSSSLPLKPQSSISRTRRFRGRGQQLAISMKNYTQFTKDCVNWSDKKVDFPGIPQYSDLVKFSTFYEDVLQVFNLLESRNLYLVDSLKALVVLYKLSHDAKFSKDLKDTFWEEVSNRFETVINADIVKVYTYLDRFPLAKYLQHAGIKDKHFLAEYRKKTFEKEMQNLLEDFATAFIPMPSISTTNDDKSDQITTKPEPKKLKCSLSTQLLYFTGKDEATQSADEDDDQASTIHTELKYFKETGSKLIGVSFWENNHNKLPTLANVYRYLRSGRPSNSSVERAFSKLKCTADPKRSLTSPEVMEARAFLQEIANETP